MPGTFPGSDGQVPTRLASDSGGWVWDWVKKLLETGGAVLSMGAIADGQLLKRQGSSIIGENPAPSPKPFLIATMGQTPASGGAVLVRVDGTSETWYELEFEDATNREVTFEVPAKSFTSLRLTWRTAAIANDVKWFAEVREKGDADTLGGGTVVASGNTVDTAKGTANQFNEATISISYTPAANKRIAVLRIFRQPSDAADTLGNVARILYIEVL